MKSNEEKINSSLTLIESWVESGLTEKEIAKKLNISYSTFRRYKGENEDLKQAIAQGKDKKNELVEQALFKCCTGYSYYEEVPTKIKEEYQGNDGIVLTKESVQVSKVKKYKGPELAAQKFWLGNKKKSTWKEDPHRVSKDKELIKLKKKEIENKEW